LAEVLVADSDVASAALLGLAFGVEFEAWKADKGAVLLTEMCDFIQTQHCLTARALVPLHFCVNTEYFVEVTSALTTQA